MHTLLIAGKVISVHPLHQETAKSQRDYPEFGMGFRF
jgi:hypothetical protein